MSQLKLKIFLIVTLTHVSFFLWVLFANPHIQRPKPFKHLVVKTISHRFENLKKDSVNMPTKTSEKTKPAAPLKKNTSVPIKTAKPTAKKTVTKKIKKKQNRPSLLQK